MGGRRSRPEVETSQSERLNPEEWGAKGGEELEGANRERGWRGKRKTSNGDSPEDLPSVG